MTGPAWEIVRCAALPLGRAWAAVRVRPAGGVPFEVVVVCAREGGGRVVYELGDTPDLDSPAWRSAAAAVAAGVVGRVYPAGGGA